MNLFIEHDASLLATLSSAAPPACDTIVIQHGHASEVLACSRGGNPLDDAWLIDAEAPGQRVLCWSGTLAADLWAGDPRNWTIPGRDALARFCDEIAPQLAAHRRTICFHPHSRHVLNDVPSVRTFLRSRVGQSFEIALAPASLLEPSMLDHLEEHLHRQFEGLGDQCAMVLLRDVCVDESEADDPRCAPAALGEGLLPRSAIRSLLRECVPDQTPIVIDGRFGGAAIARQIDWLTG